LPEIEHIVDKLNSPHVNTEDIDDKLKLLSAGLRILFCILIKRKIFNEPIIQTYQSEINSII